jgi:hypothetical protein
MRPIPAIRRSQGFRPGSPQPVAIIGWVGTSAAVVAVDGGGIEICGVQDLTVWDESIADAIGEARHRIESDS